MWCLRYTSITTDNHFYRKMVSDTRIRVYARFQISKGIVMLVRYVCWCI
jgi:hypothetical protein